MKRLHLFEVMDQPWCPDVVRRLATDFMGTFLPKMRVHEPALPSVARAIAATGATRLVDLCSGGGGPLLTYKEQIERDVGRPLSVVLTDLFPNLRTAAQLEARADPSTRYLREPVDALAVPAHVTGFRTMFESFHHFRPDEAKRILQDAVDRGEGIAVVEITERSLAMILFLLVVSPLSVLLLTPLAKPFTWWRLLLTYVVPITLLLSVWETGVSCMRTYTDDELRGMTTTLRGRAYRWEFGRRFSKGPVRWMVGYPADAVAST